MLFSFNYLMEVVHSEEKENVDIWRMKLYFWFTAGAISFLELVHRFMSSIPHFIDIASKNENNLLDFVKSGFLLFYYFQKGIR